MKPIEWVGSSYKDFVSFPDTIQQEMGYALYLAQIGLVHSSAKPLRGFGGAGIVELAEDSRLYSEIRERDLRSACLSQEVEEGDQDPA